LCQLATGQREYERERVMAGWGGFLVDLARREGRKNKKRRRKANLAKICLNFEKIKIWSKWW
jgi:hypothetical protein